MVGWAEKGGVSGGFSNEDSPMLPFPMPGDSQLQTQHGGWVAPITKPRQPNFEKFFSANGQPFNLFLGITYLLVGGFYRS